MGELCNNEETTTGTVRENGKWLKNERERTKSVLRKMPVGGKLKKQKLEKGIKDKRR